MAHKTLFVLFLLALNLPAMGFGQSQNSDIANFISSAYSNKSFTSAAVNPNDLELILRCGVRAPSVMSRKFFCTAPQRISMRGNELASAGMFAN